MINQVYQLIKPQTINVKYAQLNLKYDDHLIVRPTYLALCHADQRYYQGKRAIQILEQKLPMALIHEACGEIVFDPTNTYQIGQKVVMIPNQPLKPSDDNFYENYMKGGYFRSSGHDGFLRELVELPVDRVVPFDNIPENIAAISEFISVAVHAVERFQSVAHKIKQRIVIWGDGSLSFVTALVLKKLYPDACLIVVGKNQSKLSMFSFVDEKYILDKLPEDFRFDHAFECTGGEGSYYALNDIIQYINPQGTVLMMGVSENKIAINTRDILEKGLIFVGSSRSGRQDFIQTIDIISDEKVQRHLKKIITFEGAVKSIEDIHKIFSTDLYTPFKTVFKWEI